MIRRIFVLATLLVAAHIQAAVAADLGPLPAPSLPQGDDMSFFGTGWYIRGDLGYSRPQGPSASYNGVKFSHLSVAASPVLGAGLGYKISNWFRADVTADYLFSGSVQGTYTVPNCCLFADRTRLGGWAVLANGYVDVGTWSGITPYVGGGVGYAFTQTSRIVSQEFQPDASGAFVAQTDPISGLPVFHPYPAHTTGGFAWALSAGAALDIAPSVKLDFGYRYLNVADARMATDRFGVAPQLKSLGSHQFRIGVRYLFDQ